MYILTASYKVLSNEDIQNSIDISDQFVKDVFVGLNQEKKSIPSKYFYDAIGSQIYEEIMDLPEYYLVRSEYEILEAHKLAISDILKGNEFNLVELGAGNGYKTKILLDQFIKSNLKFEYVPIDISEAAIIDLTNSCNNWFSDLKTHGIVADYFEAIKWLSTRTYKRNCILFLGSNIGNFLYDEAVEFLFSIWNTLNHGDYMIIGFDLRKELSTMLAAYNDPEGITAKFNLNLLQRMNRELGANFDLAKFRHYEPYDVYTGAITSYIISKDHQDIYFDKFKQTIHFKKWEAIRVEQSFKYSNEDIKSLAKSTGFKIIKDFYDSKHYFTDSIWQVNKP